MYVQKNKTTKNRFSKKSFSIIVPVFNGSKTLPEILERLERVFALVSSKIEVIFVNDGSVDESWRVIVSLAKKKTFVRGLDLMRNYGQHNALLAGIRAAKHDVIITMDDDLQHPPEEIPKLVHALAPDVDVVYGVPAKEPHGVFRGLASRVFKVFLGKILRVKPAVHVSAFRAMRTRLRPAFADFSSPFVSVDVMLSWATTRFKSVATRHDPRKQGNSMYNFYRLIRHSIILMTGFSVWPLHLTSLIGFLFAGIGLAVLCFVVGRYFLEGTNVPGFPFLASIIAIFSGAQMFALGIIGEYLAQVHFRSLARPTYVIREKTNLG